MTVPGAGALVVSLDTELAWGVFDKEGIGEHVEAYRSTRSVVTELCSLFDRYEVPATWAVVAHLFDDCDGAHPNLSTGGGRDDLLPCKSGVDRELWYAPDVLSAIRSCRTEQDVGLHGYSHMIIDEQPREVAEQELETAVAAANAHGFSPSSFVFPRNRVAHLDVLAEQGLSAYRGVDARWYERRSVPGAARKPLRFLDETLGVAPPVAEPRERSGVVCVPGSNPFRPLHGGWGLVPPGRRLARAKKGLRRASERGGVYHLWFHPFNLGRDPEPLLETLEDILAYAAELRSQGDVDVLSMSDVADEFRDGRWA